MASTIQDVARRAGVSASAVSLVLNNRPHRISEETCALIRKAAAELRYTPNRNAVCLATGKSQVLGVVIPDIRNIFFAELVSGIESVALERGWNIIITSSSDCASITLENIRALTARDVSAMLVVPASDSNEQLEAEYRQAVADYGHPVIQIDRVSPDLGCSHVAIYQNKGAQTATEHLLNLGHRKIAFIIGHRSTCSLRLDGVKQAYAEKGLTLSPEDLFQGAYTLESGYAVADEILNRDYTAVFCFNDMMAYGLYKRCRERGIRVPEDLSVVGFDDILFSDYMDVPLTTVWQPARQLGIEAARQAFYQMDHPNAEQKHILLEPKLQVRSSTAHPASKE